MKLVSEHQCGSCPFASQNVRSEFYPPVLETWCLATRDPTWLGFTTYAKCLPIAGQHDVKVKEVKQRCKK